MRKPGAVEIKADAQADSQQQSDEIERIETRQSQRHKSERRTFALQPHTIGVSQNEAAQNEKKVDGEEAFEKRMAEIGAAMANDDHQGGDAAKSIQNNE